MKLHESRHDGVDIFHLEGQIDLHYAPGLRALFKGKTKSRCRALVLDLSGVTFIGSSGIAALLEYLRDSSEHDGRLCLASLTRPVQHIFDTVGLHKVMPVFSTADEAVSAMGTGCLPQACKPVFQHADDDRSALAA